MAASEVIKLEKIGRTDLQNESLERLVVSLLTIMVEPGRILSCLNLKKDEGLKAWPLGKITKS